MGKGTTSACAENTPLLLEHLLEIWNYLRVRGEYSGGSHDLTCRLELPPRARRIHFRDSPNSTKPGTTSACAENTLAHGSRRSSGRNYLRVRGEYPKRALRAPIPAELPPRARRILLTGDLNFRYQGTTSACAENTRPLRGVSVASGNYLRVRGEYGSVLTPNTPPTELPPRARRILHLSPRAQPVLGTTSACAENTNIIAHNDDA